MLYERIIDLIVILLKELVSSAKIGEKEIEMVSKLGYSQEEISTAFKWIYMKLDNGEKVYSNLDRKLLSHRVLNTAEERIISPGAFGLLMQLRELGIVNDGDIENVIEKIMRTANSSISTDEMKLFVASYLTDFDETENNFKRTMLNLNDTIN